MRTPRITMALFAVVAALMATGCGSDKETIILRESAERDSSKNHPRDQVYYFSGHVYDGTNSDRLKGYTLDLQYRDTTLSAKVDADGRFFVGPIPYFQDYTVRIKAQGYRSFMSHNEGIEFEWYDGDVLKEVFAPEVGIYMNAFLFPENLVAPATTVYVTSYDSEAKLSGTVRFAPVAKPQMADQPAIFDQSWTNHDDLQQRWVTVPLADGVATVEAGQLVFGVQYQVVAFNVAGHEPNWTSYQAGWDDIVTISLSEVSRDSLSLVYVSTQNGQPSARGEIVFVFNQPLEFGPLYSKAKYIEDIEAALSFTQEAGGTNTLNHVDDGRGVSLNIDENILTLRWNREAGLDNVDDDHDILTLTYGNLNQVLLRPVGGNHTTETTLGGEVGSNSITVDLVAP